MASFTRQPRRRRRLDRHGYEVIDLLGPDSIAAATEVISSAHLPVDHGFFVSVAHAWGPVAHSLDQQLRQILDPIVPLVLPDHAVFLAAVTSKGIRSDTIIKFHQDWTYTDERTHRSVFIWCPLVDVDADSGSLWVVPGSHRWTTGIRASRSLEATEHLQAEFAELARPVTLRAGQALVFYPSTIHGSGPNRSDHLRPALTIATAPTDARLVHFHLDAEGELTGYRVDEAFFTTNPYGSAPKGRPPVDPWARATDESTLRMAAALCSEQLNRKKRRWSRFRSTNDGTIR